MEELNNIIKLTDEAGQEVRFEFLDLVDYGGDEYVVLLPEEDDDDEDGAQVVILKVEDTSGEGESYMSVEDDEILQTVFEIFKKKFQEEFNFLDN